jgi:hypothetical protein
MPFEHKMSINQLTEDEIDTWGQFHQHFFVQLYDKQITKVQKDSDNLTAAFFFAFFDLCV